MTLADTRKPALAQVKDVKSQQERALLTQRNLQIVHILAADDGVGP